MAGSIQLSGPVVIAAVLLATLGLATTTAGCRQSPPPPPKAVSIEPEPLAEAREAMRRREYRVALELLRKAVARRPADFEAHYRFGVSASHLHQSEEASREFEWVVAHGKPGAQEVRIAHDWLASRTAPRTVPAVAERALPVVSEVRAPTPGLASLEGRAVGTDGGKPRLQLFLKGVTGTPVQNEYHALRTDQQGNFRFVDVVPGEYMLTNAVAGPPAWRLRASLVKDQHLVLDLSPENQASVRDDFPQSRP
jgi:hypothetical protein